MPSIVKLQNGDIIHADDDPQALVVRFDSARRDGTLIMVSDADDTVWINPHALLTIAQHEAYEGLARVL